MSISFSLYQLQKIDCQIQDGVKRMATIHKEMENNPEVAEALINLQASQEHAKKIKGEIDQINLAINQRKVKIEQSESALYSGNEKNPKMLQDLQTEIGSLKKQIMDLENELLEKLIEEENAIRELESINHDFNELDTKINSLNSLLTSERGKLMQTIERLRIERITALTQIPSEYLQEYERLASSKKGIAIGTVLDNSCSACGTTFTPAQCQLAKSQSAFFYCPTCHRIIYGD